MKVIVGSLEIKKFQGNLLNTSDSLESTQSTTEKANFNICAAKFQTINCKVFHRKIYVT